MGEALFVSRFQEPGTEVAVNLNRTPDHTVRQVGEIHAGTLTHGGSQEHEDSVLSSCLHVLPALHGKFARSSALNCGI